jgi:hypothetical protein
MLYSKSSATRVASGEVSVRVHRGKEITGSRLTAPTKDVDMGHGMTERYMLLRQYRTLRRSTGPPKIARNQSLIAESLRNYLIRAPHEASCGARDHRRRRSAEKQFTLTDRPLLLCTEPASLRIVSRVYLGSCELLTCRTSLRTFEQLRRNRHKGGQHKGSPPKRGTLGDPFAFAFTFCLVQRQKTL